MDNPYSATINSTQYWDQRFIADWKSNNGVEQSQFFARIAVDHLPAWFKRYIQHNQPSFCDWGCAMGNGTRLLRDLLSLQNITGIDFSRVAIEQARTSYPNISFVAADMLGDADFTSFDILFSSNTLEHFNNPWEILEKLSCFAKKFLVILIPFQEYDRHFEHFYTFETSNIPSTIRTSHYLTHFSIVNAAAYPGSYWNGKQILLIYSAYRELTGLGLTLADLSDAIDVQPPAPVPAPEPIIIETVDHKSEAILEKIGDLQEEQKRLKENFSQRLDGTDKLIATNASEKEALLHVLQSLRDELQAERRETTKKLLLLNDSLDAIQQNLSRSFTARIRDLFNTRIRSKN